MPIMPKPGYPDAGGGGNRRTVDGENFYPEKFHDIDMQRPPTTGINVLPYLTIRAYSDANTGCGELARRLPRYDGVSGGCGM